jgi:hypothetical protein
MPEMGYETRTYNDPSALTDGWHPAFLLAQTDEATPETWVMYAQSPRLWRWHFAVWEDPTRIAGHDPERQSAVSSQKFTPKGRQRASKAYSWAVALLGRQIPPGERVNLDALMPIPCRVKVERKDEYANIVDLEACPELTTYLTPELRLMLQIVLARGSNGEGGPTPTRQPKPPQPPPSQAGRQSWGAASQEPTRQPSGKPDF